MLKTLLELLQLTDIQPSSEGVYHINFDDSLDVSCIERNRSIRFESLVAVIPGEERSKQKLLTKLLTRSAQMSRNRLEGLYVDTDGARVLLQRNVCPQTGTTDELKSALNEFLCGLEAWRKYVSSETTSRDNSITSLMSTRL